MTNVPLLCGGTSGESRYCDTAKCAAFCFIEYIKKGESNEKIVIHPACTRYLPVSLR